MTENAENREVCWISFLGQLKKSKAPKGSDLEKFRQAALYDVDFCWAATEGNGNAAHDTLRYIALRMWPDSNDVPDKVKAVLSVGRVEANW